MEQSRAACPSAVSSRSFARHRVRLKDQRRSDRAAIVDAVTEEHDQHLMVAEY